MTDNDTKETLDAAIAKLEEELEHAKRQWYGCSYNDEQGLEKLVETLKEEIDHLKCQRGDYMTYEYAKETLEEVLDLAEIDPRAPIWYRADERGAPNRLSRTTLLSLLVDNEGHTVSGLNRYGVAFMVSEEDD